MTRDLARRYHDRTAHTWRSVRAGGHGPDWSARPQPRKRYPDLTPVPLPVDLAESDWPALDALAGEPPPNRQPLDASRLAALLFATAGVTRRWGGAAHERTFRAASSAGALYPIETYVVLRDLDGLAAGVYHFDPIGFEVRRIRAGDLRHALAGAAADDAVGRAPITVVLTGIPWRTTWKYRQRGYRHLFWDAGTMLANLLAVATGMAEPARVVTGFVDAEVSHLLGLDADDEVPLAVVPVGGPDATPAPAVSRPDELPPRSEPVAPAHTRDPELLATHRAGDLDDVAAVVAWRARMQGVRPARPVPVRAAPLVAAYDTVEDVILRRGSTRRFARASVPEPALAWPLAVAAQPVPTDALLAGDTLLRHHAIVHAVDDVAPGLYRAHPEGLELRRAGSLRGEATQLCLEQPLGGDGAYTVLHTADLQPVLDGGGERAYRVVQLEGGIALGRIQLAAFALGLGATGLTFYDEDVTRLVGAPAEPVCVSAVGVPAYQARPGRRPGDVPAPRPPD